MCVCVCACVCVCSGVKGEVLHASEPQGALKHGDANAVATYFFPPGNCRRAWSMEAPTQLERVLYRMCSL